MIHILIADDHAVVRRGLKQIIMEEYPSAVVGEVGDAESLVAELVKTSWDIVICDINMPGRSGLEALKQIKEINPLIPVLMMSMYSEEQYAVRVLKGGASGYLTKDNVHDELIKAIQAIKLGRKYITPSIAEKLADSLNITNNKPIHELLSNREFDVFKMLASGKAVTEIASRLSLSTTTVSTYRSRILEKLNVKTNADLTRYALENNLI
ncbi:MAG: response regulator transcription factor [Sphingobacteriales bacterium]|nr:MAG: response regulator transcription factor [Sphingobacteriales bacterium]